MKTGTTTKLTNVAAIANAAIEMKYCIPAQYAAPGTPISVVAETNETNSDVDAVKNSMIRCTSQEISITTFAFPENSFESVVHTNGRKHEHG